MNKKLCSLILHLPQTPRRFGGGQKPRLTSCCGLFSLRAATAAILALNLAVALATSVFVLYRQVNAGADWEWLGDVLDSLDNRGRGERPGVRVLRRMRQSREGDDRVGLRLG